MFETFLNSGGIDVLDRTLQFSGQRHRLIVHNIANLSTPNFRPVDVDPRSFQETMQKAIAGRRNARPHDKKGLLKVRDTDSLEFTPKQLRLKPTPKGDGILFHDRNDRNLERTMTSMAENVMVYRQAAELMRSRMGVLEMVIRERV